MSDNTPKTPHVLIVGAGITGLLIAHGLQQVQFDDNLSVPILDLIRNRPESHSQCLSRKTPLQAHETATGQLEFTGPVQFSRSSYRNLSAIAFLRLTATHFIHTISQQSEFLSTMDKQAKS